jgi:hypothetical protein
MLRDPVERILLKASLIVIMKGKRSDMALHEAMLHTAHRHLLGESLCNTIIPRGAPVHVHQPRVDNSSTIW